MSVLQFRKTIKILHDTKAYRPDIQDIKRIVVILIVRKYERFLYLRRIAEI
jgi:hypothetical protein